jgi:diadenosine tetraphosphate (Ap4A) HIT family hydrolase
MKKISEGILLHGCRLCQMKAIKEYKHWKILENEYPWDLIAKINHMIVPKRHVKYERLNQAEKKEFDLIKKNYLEKKYTLLIEVADKDKSIPSHFHIHLIIIKDKLRKKHNPK